MTQDERSRLYKLVFKDGAGKKVYEDLLDRFYHVSSYTQGDTNDTMHNLGSRDAIGFIKNYIEMKPSKKRKKKEK